MASHARPAPRSHTTSRLAPRRPWARSTVTPLRRERRWRRPPHGSRSALAETCSRTTPSSVSLQLADRAPPPLSPNQLRPSKALLEAASSPPPQLAPFLVFGVRGPIIFRASCAPVPNPGMSLVESAVSSVRNRSSKDRDRRLFLCLRGIRCVCACLSRDDATPAAPAEPGAEAGPTPGCIAPTAGNSGTTPSSDVHSIESRRFAEAAFDLACGVVEEEWLGCRGSGRAWAKFEDPRADKSSDISAGTDLGRRGVSDIQVRDRWLVDRVDVLRRPFGRCPTSHLLVPGR